MTNFNNINPCEMKANNVISNCLMAVTNTKKVMDYLNERYDLRLNLNNKQVEFRRKGETKYRKLTDTMFNTLKVDINLEGIECSKDTLKTIVFSNKFGTYSPFNKWVESLPVWDGKDHILLLAKKVKTDDQEWWEECLRKWLTNAVATAIDDSVVNGNVLILIGSQGCGKTTFFENIVPKELKEYTTSGMLNFADKETKVQMGELFMYNLDEAASLDKKHINYLKELLTRKKSYDRRAWTTLSDTFVRHCSFCGTSNYHEILHDPTGSRRFLCHLVEGKIDFNMDDIDLDQIYAQAYHLYRNGFQYWFDYDEIKKIELKNLRFKSISAEEELILNYYEPCNKGDEGAVRRTALEILQELNENHHGLRLTAEAIGKVMSAKKFKQVAVHGKRFWVFKRKSANTQQ